MKVVWNSPDTVPEVAKGEEEYYWVAVDSKHTGKIHTFLALYQNRPLAEGDPSDEDWDDDCLVDVDGQPVHSVGWVQNKSHYEFDNFYEALGFNDQYILLGWAEYQPPAYP